MSKHTDKRFAEHRARERVLHNLQLLELELRLESPRRYLDVLVELITLLFEQTGPDTIETAALRKQFNTAKARVTTRHNLRLVQ